MLSNFKLHNLVKVVNKDKYGFVNLINTTTGIIQVVYNSQGLKTYDNFTQDELEIVGLNSTDIELEVGSIVRVKNKDSMFYNSLGKVTKFINGDTEDIDGCFVAIDIFDGGELNKPRTSYTIYERDLEVYYIYNGFIDDFADNFNVGDIVLIKETGMYGYIDLIKDNTARVNYFEQSVGWIGNRFEFKDLIDIATTKKDYSNIKKGDIVQINRKGDLNNKKFGKVTNIEYKQPHSSVEISIFIDSNCTKVSRGWNYREDSLIRFKLVNSFPYVTSFPQTVNTIEQEKESKQSTDISKHYAHKIQPIEYIQNIMEDLPVNGFEGACIKDIIKYCSRFGLKDDKQKEAKKILDYALWLFLSTHGYTINPRLDNHKKINELILSYR